MRLGKSSKSVSFLRTVGVCAAILLPAATAQAASCSALKAELRKLEAGSGSQSPAAKKWSTAKKQQQKAISAAARDAKYFNCSATSSPKCQGLNSKIKRMKSNLAKIDRQLAKAGGGSAKNTKRIRQVRRAIEKKKCNAPAQSRQAKANSSDTGEKPRSFFQRLFTPQQNVEQVSARTGDREIATVRSRSTTATRRLRIPSGGTFRTVCVRTCDGYFFPVSFKAGKNQFVNDEARCSEICPAAPTELFVYRNPGGDQSQMMSLAGNVYSEQPYAYRYKSEYVEGCSCRLTQQSRTRSAWSELGTASGDRVFFSDISAGLPRSSLQPSRGGTFQEETNTPSPLSRSPLHKAQLPFFADPDTLLNLEKGFDVTAELSAVSKRLGQYPDGLKQERLSEDGFPLLTTRELTKSGEVESASTSPLFKRDGQGFRPAPSRETPVRVVGPEFFVAQ
ncbi:DUF2865 domain-containing protein [Roseibium sp. SCPC15]|uniref:DUF2865 domain-containing protein n=1 Tax=Roseibium sp. SCP15 TaxID=3141376 RepID=UPI00333CF166